MDTALFDELLESVQQMDAIVKGKARPSRVHEVDAERVKQIRKRTKLSQPAFARVIDVSVATLRNWEQGRRGIEGAARSLFTVLESNPEVVLAALMRKRKPAAMIGYKAVKTVQVSDKHGNRRLFDLRSHQFIFCFAVKRYPAGEHFI